MEPPDRVEVDLYVDNNVPVTEGDEQFAEAVGELPQDDGSSRQSGNGTPLEAGDEHDGLPPLATGNGRVAATSGPPMGSMQELAETILCAAQFVQNPVPLIPVVARPAQPLFVSGAYAHAPPIGAVPGARSRLPDPSELYALPRMPYSCVGYLPAPAGRMMPAPITVTARAAVTTTVTASIATSAVQTGLAYASLASPRAPFPGAYAIRPGYGAADHSYHLGSMFVDSPGVGMYGYPDAVQAEVGAIGGVPDGTIGYSGPSGRPEQGSLSGGLGAIPRCRPAAGGGYGARPVEARTSEQYGYMSVPVDVMRAGQTVDSGRVGWTSQPTIAGPSGPGEPVGRTAPSSRRVGVDTAGVVGSIVDTSRQTPSVWAGVEPAKLYPGVGYPYMGAGAAGALQSAYLGQPTQLRPAVPMQLANGQFYQPWVFDQGAGTVPASYWNRPVESWVRAPHGPLMGAPPMPQQQAGRRASSVKPGECSHQPDNSG